MCNLPRDTVKILLGVSIKINARVTLMNYYMIKSNRLDENACAIMNVIRLITKRVLYTIYYMENKVIKNIIIKY